MCWLTLPFIPTLLYNSTLTDSALQVGVLRTYLNTPQPPDRSVIDGLCSPYFSLGDSLVVRPLSYYCRQLCLYATIRATEPPPILSSHR